MIYADIDHLLEVVRSAGRPLIALRLPSGDVTTAAIVDDRPFVAALTEGLDRLPPSPCAAIAHHAHGFAAIDLISGEQASSTRPLLEHLRDALHRRCCDPDAPAQLYHELLTLAHAPKDAAATLRLALLADHLEQLEQLSDRARMITDQYVQSQRTPPSHRRPLSTPGLHFIGETVDQREVVASLDAALCGAPLIAKLR